MNPRQRLKFPQLRDENWIRDHLDQLAEDLGAASIAREVQCALTTAKKALRSFGLYRVRPWTPLEVKALEAFYPETDARLVALALNRTSHATWKHAWRKNVRRERPYRAATVEEAGEFWDSWRRFILEELVLRPLERTTILDLTWRPARFKSNCEDCALLDACPRDRSILPCERMTIGDYLTEGVIDERET